MKVNPNSSRRRAVWKGDFLKVNLTSPPEDGRANEELIGFLAETFQLSPGQVDIDHGATSREKELLIHDIDRTKLVRQIKQLKG